MRMTPPQRAALAFFSGLFAASAVWLGVLLQQRIRWEERLGRYDLRVKALELQVRYQQDEIEAMRSRSPADSAQPGASPGTTRVTSGPAAEEVVAALSEALSTDARGLSDLAELLKDAGKFRLIVADGRITIHADADSAKLAKALGVEVSAHGPVAPATSASRPASRPATLPSGPPEDEP